MSRCSSPLKGKTPQWVRPAIRCYTLVRQAVVNIQEKKETSFQNEVQNFQSWQKSFVSIPGIHCTFPPIGEDMKWLIVGNSVFSITQNHVSCQKIYSRLRTNILKLLEQRDRKKEKKKEKEEHRHTTASPQDMTCFHHCEIQVSNIKYRCVDLFTSTYL